MNHRIYKTSSGEVVVDTPSMKYQDLGIEHCPHPWRFRDSNPAKESFTMEVVTTAQLETLANNKNEAGSAQFYYDGATLKHDDNWEVLMMPKELVQQKYRAQLMVDLDAELAKPSPDAVAVARLQRKRETVKDMTELEIYTQYQVMLDTAEVGATAARGKVEAKIAELTP